MKTIFECLKQLEISVSSDDVAAAIAQKVSGATIIRNGSRGALWLEPMVEVETDKGRVFHPSRLIPSSKAGAVRRDSRGGRAGGRKGGPWCCHWDWCKTCNWTGSGDCYLVGNYEPSLKKSVGALSS